MSIPELRSDLDPFRRAAGIGALYRRVPVVAVRSGLGLGTLPTIRRFEGTSETRHLQERFARLAANSPAIEGLLRRIGDRGGSVFAYGGWVRDALSSIDRSRELEPRDIDFVVEGLDWKALRELLNEPFRETIFGGFACEWSGFPFDIWPLQDTFLIHELALPPTLASLLQVTDFTINALIFAPAAINRKPFLLEAGSLEALRARTIDFQCAHLPFPTIQIGRLLLYASKLGFTFGSDVTSFLARELSNPVTRGIVVEALRHHPTAFTGAAEKLASTL